MKTFRRAAREIGSWSWSVPCMGYPTVRDQLVTSHGAVDALISEQALTPHKLQVFWTGKGRQRGKSKSVSIPEGVPLEDLAHTVENSNPPASINPFISYIKVTGSGSVVLPNGNFATLDGLVEVNIFPFPGAVDIELTAHHDVWSPYAFDGSPHPLIYEKNAPRLTAVIQRIEATLGQETEPGEETFFGKPGKLGMIPPEDNLIMDGKILEVTDIDNVGWTFQDITDDDH